MTAWNKSTFLEKCVSNHNNNPRERNDKLLLTWRHLCGSDIVDQMTYCILFNKHVTVLYSNDCVLHKRWINIPNVLNEHNHRDLFFCFHFHLTSAVFVHLLFSRCLQVLVRSMGASHAKGDVKCPRWPWVAHTSFSSFGFAIYRNIDALDI